MSAATHEANWSYRDVLRNRHVAGLLLGDLLASVGTDMIIVAMPVQTPRRPCYPANTPAGAPSTPGRVRSR
jgi:hypothetical protein